jgi:hypothetical protein
MPGRAELLRSKNVKVWVGCLVKGYARELEVVVSVLLAAKA